MKKCIQPEQAEKKNTYKLRKNIMYTWRIKIIYMQGGSPPSIPAPTPPPPPLTFLMVHPLVIVEKKRTIGLNQSDNGSPFPLQKLYGEWVQAFGETVCGIVWVDKDLLQLVMVLKATINQSSLTLVHANDPTNRFAGSFYPFSLQFLVERIVRGEYFHLAPLFLFPALGTR